jgi:DNA-binding XRE family transcriptional regulator
MHTSEHPISPFWRDGGGGERIKWLLSGRGSWLSPTQGRASVHQRGCMRWIRANELHDRWMENPACRREYDELALASALLEARSRFGLTQAQVARRMKTTQTAIARLEGGRAKPSTRTLECYAHATRHRLVIGFAPAAGQRSAK